MNTKRRIKLIREGEFMAEVDVEWIVEPPAWEPYLSMDDAHKLDRVRAALKAADILTASSLATVYRTVPVGANPIELVSVTELRHAWQAPFRW